MRKLIFHQFVISNIANKGVTVTKGIMKQLKDKGFIKRIGPDKGGYWEVIE